MKVTIQVGQKLERKSKSPHDGLCRTATVLSVSESMIVIAWDNGKSTTEQAYMMSDPDDVNDLRWAFPSVFTP